MAIKKIIHKRNMSVSVILDNGQELEYNIVEIDEDGIWAESMVDPENFVSITYEDGEWKADIPHDYVMIYGGDPVWSMLVTAYFGPHIAALKPKGETYKEQFEKLQHGTDDLSASVSRSDLFTTLVDRDFRADVDTANEAAAVGNTDVLNRIYAEFNIMPDDLGFQAAIDNNHVKVITWMINRDFPFHILWLAEILKQNRLEILECLAGKRVSFLTSDNGTFWSLRKTADNGFGFYPSM